MASAATTVKTDADQSGAFQDNRPKTHAEWRLHQRRWKWLGDSYDGGESYRQAMYGLDLKGMPVRNLIRHKNEYPDARDTNLYGLFGRPDGTSQLAQATDDDYEMRRARTPIPTVFPRVIRRHLSKIYSQTPKREGPNDLLTWFKDVDGTGSTMAEYMRDTVGPLLSSYGQLDVYCDRPMATEADRKDILNMTDLAERGLNKVVLSYFLPENVYYWELFPDGTYKRILISEPNEDGNHTFCFWEPGKWTRFSDRGKKVDGEGHTYGRPPIARLFDRKRIRCKNVGLPRYEDIAEIMLNMYNTQSELILSNSTQAHAVLQGPEEFCQNNTHVPVGIGRLMPMKRNATETHISYQGFEAIEFPKGSIDSLRVDVQDMKDDIAECALLTKPAGGAGTTGKTVGQSGVSKRMDSEDGNTYLTEIAGMLESNEVRICELRNLVAYDGKVPAGVNEAIKICYAKDFDLFGPDELAALITDWQTVRATAGGMPIVDAAQLKRLLRLIMLGAPSELFVIWDLEIDQFVAVAAAALGQVAERAQKDLRNPEIPAGENIAALTAGSDSSYGNALMDGSVPVQEPSSTY